jgi:hypothetical protein
MVSMREQYKELEKKRKQKKKAWTDFYNKRKES